jgi:hypothetical protein
MPWDEAVDAFAGSHLYWFTTVMPGGAPHVRPVLGVWLDGTMFTTSAGDAVKARNVVLEPRCTMSASAKTIDLVLDGTAERIVDGGLLQRVVEQYHAKYGWPAEVEGDAFVAPYGAPTAGPGPYEVLAIRPDVVHAFGTAEGTAERSTRFRF